MDFWKMLEPYQWLTVFGILLSYALWKARKYQLEIQKLRLEIDELKIKQSRIYLPTSDEIQSVLKNIDKFTSKLMSPSFRSGEPLMDFATQFKLYLKELLDQEFMFMAPWIPKERIPPAPDPGDLATQWEEVKIKRSERLSPELIKQIDFIFLLLSRRKILDQEKGENADQSRE